MPTGTSENTEASTSSTPAPFDIGQEIICRRPGGIRGLVGGTHYIVERLMGGSRVGVHQLSYSGPSQVCRADRFEALPAVPTPSEPSGLTYIPDDDAIAAPPPPVAPPTPPESYVDRETGVYVPPAPAAVPEASPAISSAEPLPIGIPVDWARIGHEQAAPSNSTPRRSALIPTPAGPRKFWMVGTDITAERYTPGGVIHLNPPTRKYYDELEAAQACRDMAEQYGHSYFLLESVEHFTPTTTVSTTRL